VQDHGRALIESIRIAFTRGKLEELMILYDEDAVLHHPLVETPIVGRDAIAGVEEGLFTSYSEHEWIPEAEVSAGDRVAVSYVLRLRNTGGMPTRDGLAPATNKILQFAGASFFRLGPQGTILEEHRFAASESLRTQLGFEPL
jgi:hypothetical protein